MVKSHKQIKTKTNKQLRCQLEGCDFVTTYDNDKKALSNHCTRKHRKTSDPKSSNSGCSNYKKALPNHFIQSTVYMSVHEEASDPHSIAPCNSVESANVNEKLTTKVSRKHPEDLNDSFTFQSKYMVLNLKNKAETELKN